MPKYRKDRKFASLKEEQKREGATETSRMFGTSIRAYLIAAVFLVLSIIFNSELIRPFGTDIGRLLKLIEYGFRGLLVIGFFMFALISWGNLKELRGSIIGIKEIIILMLMALLQTILNSYVFLAAVVGVTIVSIYIWLMQVKIEN